MAKNCGCAQDVCGCLFESSDAVEIEGFGTPSSPIVLSRKMPLQTLDTSTVTWELLDGDPATIQAFVKSKSNVQIFSTPGASTWTKPAGVTMVRVLVIAGGNGGSGGAYATTPGSGLLGGAGGLPGVVNSRIWDASDLSATASVVVGAGGAGGPGRSSNGSGMAGGIGGDSAFISGSTIIAARNTSAGVTSPIPRHSYGGPGRGTDPLHYALAPGAGGEGGGYADFGRQGSYSAPARGSQTSYTGAPYFSPGRDNQVTFVGGGGAGALGGNIPGSAGGLYGGGGGGGGYGSSGYASGPGGKGAGGVVVVMAW